MLRPAWRASALALALALAFSFSASAEELRRPRKLTVSLADDMLGQLSPDGKRIFFVSNRNATSQIFTIDLTAPAAKLLFDEGADVTWPRLSPDGKRLAYISYRDDASGQLCVRDLQKLERRCLAAGGALETSWGGDDELVLLSRGSLEGDLGLARVHAGAKALRAQPMMTRNLNGPEVSPDGKWLVYVPLVRAAVRIGPAFAAQAGRALVLRRFDRPGDPERTVQLPLPGGSSQPAFSSDGKWIYFTQFLNDTDENGVLDGDDHGVLFRVPFSGDPAAMARAVPEQLSSGAWNCQYPTPAATHLIATCARGGSLDLYLMPLDGIVPDAWPAARVAEELEASRDRWEALMLRSQLLRRTPDPGARATLLLETVRSHLGLGEYEAALFHARALAQSGAPALAALAELIEPLIAERRGLRAFDRGEEGHSYLASAAERRAAVAAKTPASPAARALQQVVLSELDDHLGDKSAALDELGRAVIDADTPAFVVEATAARAEALYRELDLGPKLVERLRALVDHRSLPEAERLRLGGVYAREVMRGLPRAQAHEAARRERAGADETSARAFALALWPCLDEVDKATLAAARACAEPLFAGTTSPARRYLITEVVRRAELTDGDELEYALLRRHVRELPRDAVERRYATRIYRHVVEDFAYDAIAAGRPADAAREFDTITKDTLSLEAEVGYIEASLAAGVAEPSLFARYAGADDAAAHFARAYLEVRKLPDLDGPEFDRAYAKAAVEMGTVERLLPQQCEVEALRGAMLHLAFLEKNDRSLAEEANTHYLLALDLAHDNARYRAMALSELALLHEAVGNYRIAIGHFDARAALPFADHRVAFGHAILRARAWLHVGQDDKAAADAAAAVKLAKSAPELARFLPLGLDRAALYALAAADDDAQPERARARAQAALAYYDEADAMATSGAHGAGTHDDAHNRIVRWLGRGAAAIAAQQPARALADLERVDAAFARPDIWRVLDWPEATHDEERETYELLRLGLRGRAERALGRLEDARRSLTARHERLLARAKARAYDDDLAGLAAAESQLADLARARGAGEEAARLASDALLHAAEYSKRTGAPLSSPEVQVLGYAAELHLVSGVRADAFSFDIARRLGDAFDELAQATGAERRQLRLRFGVYLTLLGLDRGR